MSAFASGAARAFERLSDRGGAQPGDVRLFDRDPGPSWVAENGSVPYSDRRRQFLLANSLSALASPPSPLNANTVQGAGRIGDRVFVWQDKVIAYTDDGETFTTISVDVNKGNSGFGGVVVFKGLTIATYYSGGEDTFYVGTLSADGTNFVNRANIGGFTPRGIYEVDGALYIAGGSIWRSTDGLSWVNVASTYATSIAVSSKYILASGPGRLMRTPRANPGQFETFYSPNSETFDFVFCDEDDRVYYAFRGNLWRGPPDGGQSAANHGQVFFAGTELGNPLIVSMASVDGLFVLGCNRSPSLGDVSLFLTTRDFSSYSIAGTFPYNSSSAMGVARIYQFGGKLLLLGSTARKSGIATQRSAALERRPAGKKTHKAYTRL